MFKYPKPHFCTTPLSPPGSGDSVRRCARSRAILGIVVQMPGYTELPFPGCSATGLPQRSLPSVSGPSPPSCHRFLSLCSYSWCTRDGPEQGLRSPEKHFRFRSLPGGWSEPPGARAGEGRPQRGARGSAGGRAPKRPRLCGSAASFASQAGSRGHVAGLVAGLAAERPLVGVRGPGRGSGQGAGAFPGLFLKKMHAAFPLDDDLCFP